jgi:hypothetical protein
MYIRYDSIEKYRIVSYSKGVRILYDIKGVEYCLSQSYKIHSN